MNRFILLLLGFLTLQSFGQVGIGTEDPKAMLHIENSGTAEINGIIIPKMTTAQKTNLTTSIGSLSISDKDSMSGFLFVVQDISDENELWQYNRATDKLEPVYRKLKSFARVGLGRSISDGSSEQFLEFSDEIIDPNDNFKLILSESSGPLPTDITTNYYGFVADRAGYYEVYVQYHTSTGAGAGNYSLNAYVTEASETYNGLSTRELVGRSSHSSTGAEAFNVVKRSLSTIVRLEEGDILDFSWQSSIVITGGLSTDSNLSYVLVKPLSVDY